MTVPLSMAARKGARQIQSVPADVLAQLSSGTIETVNLMEWLAADMPALARTLAESVPHRSLAAALRKASGRMKGCGLTERLRIAGSAIAATVPLGSPQFESLATHKSDLVRQWVCYAVNDSSLSLSLDQRLEGTLRFAADANMSVRETAWMAFRPRLAEELDRGLQMLESLGSHEEPTIRRFVVEVTRPRSVWGAHLPALKRRPGLALLILEQVRDDPSRYVQLAVGNWLNDVSKTKPEWVLELSRRWQRSENPNTKFILKRGLRTVARMESAGKLQSPVMAPRRAQFRSMGALR